MIVAATAAAGAAAAVPLPHMIVAAVAIAAHSICSRFAPCCNDIATCPVALHKLKPSPLPPPLIATHGYDCVAR